MRCPIFLSICLLVATVSFAQEKGSIQGQVKSRTGEVLPGALITLGNSQKSVVANTNGQFFFEDLPAGTYLLRVNFLGFKPFQDSVRTEKGTPQTFVITLDPEEIFLEGMVVTAQRRAESIHEVPIAVTSYQGDFLSKTNTYELDALSELVPGLQVQLQSVNNPSFVVRGITSDDGDSRVEPRVSVFQDGVSISKSRGSVVELFDMERIEVLKGPQGTLFGRGASIGAVHLIQNKARRDFSSQLRLGGGDFGQRLVTGHVNTPLSDNLFLRVSGIYNHRDGYIANLSGGSLNGKATRAGRFALKYLPGKDTSVDFIFNFQKDTPPGTGFKSGTYAPVGGDTSPFTFGDLEKGTTLGVNRSVWGGTLLVNHTLNANWDLSSITAFRKFDSFEAFDSDGTRAAALFLEEKALGKQFSQELRLNFSGESKIRGFTGLSFFSEDGSQNLTYSGDERSLYTLFTPTIRNGISGASVIPQDLKAQLLALIPLEPLLINGRPNLVSNLPNVPLLFGAKAGALLKPLHRETSTNFGRTQAYELFADGTYDISTKLSLTAGLRATYEKVSGALEVPEAADAGNLGVFLTGSSRNTIFTPTQGRQEASDTFWSAVGRVAVNYQPTSQVTLYGTISRGRRPNVIQVQARQTDVLQAETVWSYESGLKLMGMDERLQFDLSGYFYDYSNFQTAVILADQEGFRVETRDEGAAKALGFETSLRYALARNLGFFANYGFIDAGFSELDVEGNPQNLAGNTFRLTPKQTLSSGLDVGFPLSEDWVTYFRPTFSYKSRVFFEETNLPGIEQGGYGLLNLRVGINFKKKYDLMGYMTNALNRQFVLDAGNTGAAFGIPTFIAGPPRMVGVQFTVNLH